jgi:hypothetical protein
MHFRVRAEGKEVAVEIARREGKLMAFEVPEEEGSQWRELSLEEKREFLRSKDDGGTGAEVG